MWQLVLSIFGSLAVMATAISFIYFKYGRSSRPAPSPGLSSLFLAPFAPLRALFRDRPINEDLRRFWLMAALFQVICPCCGPREMPEMTVLWQPDLEMGPLSAPAEQAAAATPETPALTTMTHNCPPQPSAMLDPP